MCPTCWCSPRSGVRMAGLVRGSAGGSMFRRAVLLGQRPSRWLRRLCGRGRRLLHPAGRARPFTHDRAITFMFWFACVMVGHRRNRTSPKAEEQRRTGEGTAAVRVNSAMPGRADAPFARGPSKHSETRCDAPRRRRVRRGAARRDPRSLSLPALGEAARREGAASRSFSDDRGKRGPRR